jgi:hypothetical protein
MCGPEVRVALLATDLNLGAETEGGRETDREGGLFHSVPGKSDR